MIAHAFEYSPNLIAKTYPENSIERSWKHRAELAPSFDEYLRRLILD